MRILYGVVGEGMGHAIRSRVVLEHLLDAGHHLEIMASGRAVEFLRKHFAYPEVNKIHGLHIVYKDNRVRAAATLWENLLKGTVALPGQLAAYFDLIRDFAPQIVISDFESWTYIYAKMHRLPILSVDNMQIINRCAIDWDVVSGHRRDFEIARTLVASKLPFCDWYLISTFFRPRVRKKRTSLHAPILRPEILERASSRGDHLLVYQTAEGHEELAQTLNRTGFECRIYGMRRGITSDQVEGNLRFRPFSETEFIRDLATARAVIAGGGFTLMGEAVYLRKPVLSVPVRGQFEQVLNGRYLEKLGYGCYAESLDEPRTIQSFVERIGEYEGNLQNYLQHGNVEFFAELDQLLTTLGQ